MKPAGQTIRLRMGAAHGDYEHDFVLPPGWEATVCAPADRPPISDDAIHAALESPVGAQPLSHAARGAGSAAILVDDFRRPTPAEKLCLLVIAQLQAAGIQRERIAIVLGNGAHRTMTRAECRKRLGKAFGMVGQVVSHDAYSPRVRYVGLTSAGTPVLLNEAAVDADFTVSISTVYPHTIAGWGGGAKMVIPGIAHVSTIHYHHGRVTAGAWACKPTDSPNRKDLEEAAALLGLRASLCCVVNSRQELCGLYAGDPTAAHRRAVALARKVGDTPVTGGPHDLVIANAYPFDADGTQYGKAQAPASLFRCPVLMVNDFADPSTYHGLYDGPPGPYRRRTPPVPPEHTDVLLMNAPVFFYSPQYGKGFVPQSRSWYGDSDWEQLMADMSRRFPRAKVAVLPAAPLQIPRFM
jgi:hypothetical protein